MLWRNEDYESIAAELLQTDSDLSYISEVGIAFAVCSSDVEKKHNRKITFGDCTKVPDKFRWCIPFDFQITIYEPNIAILDDKQLRTLLKHEMLHMGADMQGNEPVLYVVPHDVEEFDCIISTEGLHWADKGERERNANNNEGGGKR